MGTMMTYTTPYLEAFTRHKGGAKRRGVSFLLTFKEWLDIWKSSGHLAERGRYRGNYNMARFGDKGPYAVGNVKIIRHEENVSEASLGHTLSAAGREKVAASKRGKPLSDKWRDTISKAKQGNQSRRGTITSAEGIANMCAAQQRRWARVREERRGEVE